MRRLIAWLSAFNTRNLSPKSSHMTPSSGPLDPIDFFAAMEQTNQQAFPCQVCDRCAPGLFEHYGYHVADNSWCSQCHEQGECLDVALIEYYRKHQIDNETISHTLPRARWGSKHGVPSYQSLEDIKSAYPLAFDASENSSTTK